MASQTLNRIVRLESAMANMAEVVATFVTEMRSFKDEMRQKEETQRDEMGVFKDEMRSFKDEMRVFKDEMDVFKDEMRSFKDEAAEDRRDLNRRLGDIANSQGRLVEDIVAPSVPRILCEELGVPADAPIGPGGPRLRLRDPKDPRRVRELDVVAAHGRTALVVEVKSRLSPREVTAFARSLPDARALLAPLGVREVIGAVATLHADPSIVKHASKLGLLVLAVGDALMERKNAAAFVPRRV